MIKLNLMRMNLQYFAEGAEGAEGGSNEQTELTIDAFKSFAETNEEAQKFLQSQSQSVADKQLEAWKANNLEKERQAAIKSYEESKKNKSPEQFALEKLQEEFNAEKALRVKSENTAFVAKQISGLSLDGDLKDSVSEFMLNNLVSADTEFTTKAVEGFTSVLSAIQAIHQEQINNMEMQSAFGGKQQQTPPKQEVKDPMDMLGQQLGKLNL